MARVNNVDFILDEAGALGHMECIDDAVDKLRAYGVRLYFFYQSLAQLKQCFPNGQDQTLLSNTTQIFFSVNDVGTAEYISNWMGETTIAVESGGTSSGSSSSWSFGGQPQRGGGTSDTVSSNWQLQGRKLLKPEEIIGLSPRTAITLTPGLPPICTTLLRYYEEKWLQRPPGVIRRLTAACCTVLSSLVLFVATAAAALALTLAVKDEPWAQQVTTPQVQQWLERIDDLRLGLRFLDLGM
jgi:type IV secretion system protein VirD4